MTESENPTPEQDGSQAQVPPPPPSPYGQPQQPPTPYAQTPQQPTAPYGQQTPQQPYAPAPYGQAPQQPYGYGAPAPYQGTGGQQPPMPPYYPPQPPYPAAPQQPKRKVWPWVLGACLLVFVLGIGGCVGCVSCAMLYDRAGSYHSYDSYYNPYEDYDSSGSGNGPGNGNGSGNGSGSGSGSADAFSGITLDNIKDAAGDLPNIVKDGSYSGGVYEVGAGKDMEPGRYFLEGAPDAEGDFYVFDYDNDNGSYQLDDAVVYFGNYFADFEAGDVVVYMPGNETARLYAVDKADFKPQTPLGPGLYRVGTDIQAGTYTITVDEAAAKNAREDCAAFVMKDLDFNDDSITDTKYVIAGGSQTVTVKDGDYLELYATTATATK